MNTMNEEQKEFINQIAEEARRRNADVVIFGDVNLQNIVVDTCSVEYDICLEILKKSNKIQIPYVVLEEFDEHLKDEETTSDFKFSIREFQDEVIYQPDKYVTIPLGYKSGVDADNLIIGYIYAQPKEEQPTILTADKNLALRASALGIGTILYVVENPKSKLKRRKERQKQNLKKEKTNEIPATHLVNGIETTKEVEDEETKKQYCKLGFNLVLKEGKNVTIKKHSPHTQILKEDGEGYKEILLDVEEMVIEYVPQEFIILGKVKGTVQCIIINCTEQKINAAEYEFYTINEVFLQRSFSENLIDEIQKYF